MASVLAVAVVLGACSGASPRTLPEPTITDPTVPEPTTSSIDLSRVSLDTVPGETTTSLRQTGTNTISGIVGGPEGLVAGATVRIERVVGDAVQTTEVLSAADGTWVLQQVPAGRYRVRAYVPPELTMVEPKVFFFLEGETQEIPLQLERFRALEVQSGTTPSAPIVGDAVNLAVRVSRQVVDDDGVVRLQPLDNVPVRVQSTGWRELDEEPVGVTDDSGQVLFSFECDRVTPVTASAVVGEDRERFALEVPDCAPRPTTTTAEESTTTTAG